MIIAEPRSDDSDLESEELDFDDGEWVSTKCVKMFIHLLENWTLIRKVDQLNSIDCDMYVSAKQAQSKCWAVGAD